MPRIRLAYDLIDRDGARRVAAQRMKEVLAAALVQAERVEKVKLSQDTLSEAITVGDFNKDQMIQFSEFCNILLKLHVVYAIQKKNIEKARQEQYYDQFECRSLLKKMLFEDPKKAENGLIYSSNTKQNHQKVFLQLVTEENPDTIQLPECISRKKVEEVFLEGLGVEVEVYGRGVREVGVGEK